MKKRSLRKKLLTIEAAQLKYLGLLMFSMLVPLVFVGGLLYFLIFNLMAEQLGVPEYIAINLTPVVQKINMMLLVGIPPLMLLLLLWGIVLTHRFAGPLERVKNEIDDISRTGDYTKRIRLRKHDDLRPLADSINRLLNRACGGK